MLIVKPYGRSETVREEAGGLCRRLRRNSDGRAACSLDDVAVFARSHPELVIAQWISAIDKVATKPRGSGKPTREQRRLRDALAGAAFELLEAEGLLNLSQRRDELERRWHSKVHPYGDKDDGKARGREKGRWYARFAGDRKPGEIDHEAAREIVRKLRDHLHAGEYRIGGGRPDRRQGRIAARAASIANSVAALPAAFPGEERPWSKADETAYGAAGDVAASIRRAACQRETSGQRERKPRVSPYAMRDAAPILFAHYGRLFRGEDGGALSVAEARKAHPGLFALHGAVKATYAGILKGHRKRSVARLLPADMEALLRLVERRSGNRDLAALLRLGKAIHYRSSPDTPAAGEDAPGNAVDRWPDDVAQSRYLGSEGQAEIKRNEAFVRVWRNTVALAARTAKDWADAQGRIDRDILMENKIERATGTGFDAGAFRAKLLLLFGDRAELFRGGDDAFERSVLRLALEGWAELRHGSFHFKGRGGFVRALKHRSGNVANPAAIAAARKLLARDGEERQARLVATLRAAHVEHYFDQSRIDALVAAIVNGAPPTSPMPRLRRVLDRAEKAWRHAPWLLRLPSPGNRAELEKPGRMCRYTAVKLLYERAFPAWLEGQGHGALNVWIERAAGRATGAARKINKDEHAVARAAGLVRLESGEGIAELVDMLSAATASELRVQRGYGSDAEQARKQAKYIDDLRCDVVAQGFEAWLAQAGLDWVLDELGDGTLPEGRRGNLDAAPEPVSRPPREAADWEAVLYFLLHLVPVDAVNRLQHQLPKWSILEGAPSDDAEAVARLFDLYIAMHDAKFEGGEGMAGAEALKGLFDSEDAFSRACPTQPGEDSGRYVPWRGLREMLRFGGLQTPMKMFQQHPITDDDIDRLAAFEDGADGTSPIARQQEERERLHAKWVEEKREFSDGDKRAYRKALAEVVRHRRLAAHVRLVDHARLHRLLMAVLGRLVDYAGLWERDLYFATLALVWLRNTTPEDVFDDRGLEHLREGQIVEAIRRLRKSEREDGRAIFHRLEKSFGDGFLDKKNGIVCVRNALVHFNMLQNGAPIDLTKCIDDTRRLMAYDRKLKNAVSKSIIELMARENLDLAWTMADHRLSGATVKARQARHLEDGEILEDLHGERFVAMAAALFAGKRLQSDGDILSPTAAERAPSQAGKRRDGAAKRHRRPISRRRRR